MDQKMIIGALSPFRASLLMAQGLHAVAAFIWLWWFRLEIDNCDRSDSLAAAWGVAAQSDLLLSLIIWTFAGWRNHGARRALLAGWAVGQIPLVAVSWPLIAYFDALPGGCGP